MALAAAATFAAPSSPPSPTLVAIASSPTTAPGVAGNDYQQMLAELSFTPSELRQFQEALAVRDAGDDAWRTGPRGTRYRELLDQIDEARQRSDELTNSQLFSELSTLRQEDYVNRLSLRREFNRVLTPLQIRQWAGYVLYRASSAQLHSAEMTPAQQAAAKALCRTLAEVNTTPDAMDRNPYLLPEYALQTRATQQIIAAVLSDDQRQQMGFIAKP